MDIEETAKMGKRLCYNNLIVQLKNAQKGYKLLKRKTDALNLKLRQIAREMLLAKFAVEGIMKDAFLSLAEVKFAAGNIITDYILQNAVHAHVKLKSRNENMASVEYAVFEIMKVGSDPFELAGLARGGQHLARLRKIYQGAIEFIVQLASLQSCFAALYSAKKSNETRVKALEFVIIPRIQEGIRYIGNILEEMEREEFYRLKMVKTKKKKHQEFHESEPEPEREYITIFNDPDSNFTLFRL